MTSKRVVIKVGFLDEAGDLVNESKRILEWETEGIAPKGLMTEIDTLADKLKADVTIPGTSQN